MEPRYLLDTNICTYIRQKGPEEVLRRFRKLRPGLVTNNEGECRLVRGLKVQNWAA